MSTQLEEIRAGARKFVAGCDLAKHGITWGAIVFLGWKLIEVVPLALQSKPATLTAFAQCMKEWNIPAWVTTTAAAMFAIGWRRSHRRNEKLTMKNGELRHEIEEHDEVHASSGLDPTGATPKKKR